MERQGPASTVQVLVLGKFSPLPLNGSVMFSASVGFLIGASLLLTICWQNVSIGGGCIFTVYIKNDPPVFDYRDVMSLFCGACGIGGVNLLSCFLSWGS